MPEATSTTVSACDLVMGDSGSGKTSLLATLAEWVWRKFHKVTHLYSADPGGWTTEIQALINRGVIRAWKVPSRDPEDRLGLAFETCLRASQGYWPKEFLDPEKGRVPVGVELIAPVAYEFSLICAKGHVVRRTSMESQLAGQYICAPDGNVQNCGLQVSLRGGAKVVRTVHQMKGFEDVGTCAYDGLTSLCAWAMRDLQDRGAAVELGERDALKSAIRIVSGGVVLGSNSPAHYGSVQNLAERMVNAAGAIPYLVARPVWTALEKRGTDDKSQIVVYGPDLPGSAKTAVVPQWVGNLLGVCGIPDKDGRNEWRMYLRRYYLPGDPIPHLAKTRVAPGYLPECLTDGPVDEMGRPQNGTKAFTQFNLGTFYELEAAALRQQQAEKDTLFADAPGIVSVIMGEAKIDEGTGMLIGTPPAPSPGPAPAAVGRMGPPPAVGGGRPPSAPGAPPPAPAVVLPPIPFEPPADAPQAAPGPRPGPSPRGIPVGVPGTAAAGPPPPVSTAGSGPMPPLTTAGRPVPPPGARPGPRPPTAVKRP